MKRGAPRRLRTARAGAVTLLVMATSGCERKALDPFECQELGARVLGITDSRDLADPRVKHELDTFTFECLTTPFDRTVMRCIEETGRTRACLVDFARRRPDLQKEREDETR